MRSISQIKELSENILTHTVRSNTRESPRYLFPIIILFNFCPDTRGVVVFTFFRLTCSVVLWGGRNPANKYQWHVLTVIQSHWVCLCSRHVCFPSLYYSGSRLLCRELSDAGPGLHALPTSKLLRFRFSGTPQRRRLDWACVLRSSQV